uniref:Kinesin motor domain-containing protein n=1 Tax=Caenorhabditis tropicalis TaxID=1561998 RepID=A0A1I7UDM8_9PELO
MKCFANGELIDGVNQYRVSNQIRKSAKNPLDVDIYVVKDVDQGDEYRMKIARQDTQILKFIFSEMSHQKLTVAAKGILGFLCDIIGQSSSDQMTVCPATGSSETTVNCSGSPAEGLVNDHTINPKDLGASDQGKALIKMILEALVDESIVSREKSMIIKKLQEDLKVSEEKRLESEASNELKLEESELRGKALESVVKSLKKEVTPQKIWINDTEWAVRMAREEKAAVEQYNAMQQTAFEKVISQLKSENGYLKEKLSEAMANEGRFWKAQEVKEEMVEEEEPISKASRKRQGMDDEGLMVIEKKRREG